MQIALLVERCDISGPEPSTLQEHFLVQFRVVEVAEEPLRTAHHERTVLTAGRIAVICSQYLELCACVVLKDPDDEFTLEDLTNIADRQGLARYKWPEFIEIVDALPLSPAGKVRRLALRESILGRIGSRDVAHG